MLRGVVQTFTEPGTTQQHWDNLRDLTLSGPFPSRLTRGASTEAILSDNSSLLLWKGAVRRRYQTSVKGIHGAPETIRAIIPNTPATEILKAYVRSRVTSLERSAPVPNEAFPDFPIADASGLTTPDSQELLRFLRDLHGKETIGTRMAEDQADRFFDRCGILFKCVRLPSGIITFRCAAQGLQCPCGFDLRDVRNRCCVENVIPLHIHPVTQGHCDFLYGGVHGTRRAEVQQQLDLGLTSTQIRQNDPSTYLGRYEIRNMRRSAGIPYTRDRGPFDDTAAFFRYCADVLSKTHHIKQRFAVHKGVLTLIGVAIVDKAALTSPFARREHVLDGTFLKTHAGFVVISHLVTCHQGVTHPLMMVMVPKEGVSPVTWACLFLQELQAGAALAKTCYIDRR